MEPAAATTTAGIYCKTCGYDLRASAEAGRCPECGRVFSPDDPKSFRKRPFAAEWKRALGRWAKRGAVLLLVLTVLLAGCWGWLYWGWKQEQAALAQARGWQNRAAEGFLGGAPGRWLYYHRVPGSFVLERVAGVRLFYWATDADLRPLRRLPRLEVLQVDAPITDAGMAHLRQCPRLRWLSIVGSRVTDAGLAALRDLPRLESLEIISASSTDAGLAELATLTELKTLNLHQAPLTGAGLVHLEPLGKLRDLGLSKTRVSDASLAPLARLPALEYLDLRGTRVTDAGLVHLERLRVLRHLDLMSAEVTDAGLVHLEKLRTLKYLVLIDTKVTPAGLAKLRAALPGCRISGP